MIRKILLLLPLLCASFTFAQDDLTQLKILIASDRGAMDLFGYSVSISGDYAIVGAYQEDHNESGASTLNDAGSAYIFKRSGSSWTQIKKLVASDRGIGDLFGYSVSISGDYAIVGAYHEAHDASGGNPLVYAGSAYIFKKDQGGIDNWGQIKKIVASDRGTVDYFGYSVSISGDYAIVGAYAEDPVSGADSISNAGSAYIFKKDQGGNDNWGQVKKIVASDRTINVAFGICVSISGDYAIVGAYKEAHDASGGNQLGQAGSAYIFKKDQGGSDNWGQIKKIVASDRDQWDFFGWSVSISGDYAIVGAYQEDHNESGGDSLIDAGSAYIFKKDQGGSDNWGQIKKIVASDREISDNFGWSVSISGDHAIVGVINEDDTSGTNTVSGAGSAFIFKKDQGGIDNWGQIKKIVASDRTYANFGNSVSISGDYTIVGAYAKNLKIAGGSSILSGVGSAYIFGPVFSPTIQTSSVIFSSPQATTQSVSWTIGDGEKRAVFVKQANTGTATPVDAATYSANTTFGSGTQIAASGWYCVYNGTGTSVTVTGLTAGSDYIVQVFEYNGGTGIEKYLTSTASGNPAMRKTLATQSITFDVLANKNYGDADFALAASASSGLAVSYTSSNNAVATVSGGTVTIVGFGTTTITASQGGNDTYAATSVQQNFTVNKKALAITGLTGVNKVYNRTNTATLSGIAALSGVVPGDAVNVTLGGTAVATFANGTIGTGKAITVTGYTLSGSAAGNYTLTQPTGLTADITSKSLTITGLTGVNKVYDGTNTATLSGTAALSGVVLGDAVNVTLGGTAVATFADGAVGNGKAITVTGYTISGPAAGNYTLIQPTGLTATITAVTVKSLTITGLSGVNKVYDGTNTATLSGTAVLSGVEPGDAGNVTLGGTAVATFADGAVGNGKAITVTGYTISGSAAGNYTLIQPTGLTANITAITGKSLTITGLSGVTKVYDGTNTATLSGTAVLSGVEPGDAGNVTLGGTIVATFVDGAVGNGKAITVTGYTISGSAAGNYTLIQPTGLSAAITAKTLQVTGLTATPKYYDGTTSITLNGGTLVGIISNDSVTIGSITAAFSDAQAGTGKPITVSNISLNGSRASFYTVELPTGLTGSIVKPLPAHAPEIRTVFSDTMGTVILLNWDSVTNATGYRIEFCADSTFTTPMIDTTVSDGLKYFANLVANKTLWMRIAAINSNGNGPWSDTLHFRTMPTPANVEDIAKVNVRDTIVEIVPEVTIATGGNTTVLADKVIVVEMTKDTIANTDASQVSHVYDFTGSSVTQLTDSITITLSIPDTLLDGTPIPSLELIDIRIYEVNTTGVLTAIYNAVIDTSARTISYKTDHLGIITLAIDRKPPTIVDNTERSPKAEGGTPVIAGKILDIVQNCQGVVYFRKGGAYEYDSLTVSINADGSFTLPINGIALDLNGFEYFISAYDGNKRKTSDRQNIPVKVAAVADSAPIASMQWRLLSTPLNLLDNSIPAFFDNMGEYGKDWKLFRRSLTSVVDSFVEHGPNLASLQTGYSYWIKSYKNLIQVAADSGVTTPISSCYEITIPAKTWSAIGNPYMFTVGWKTILDSSGIHSSSLIGPYTYKDSAWIPPSQIDRLVPWRGYYVYNSGDSAVKMRIPSLKFRQTGTVAKSAVNKNKTSLELIVSSRFGRDYRNYFGFAAGAGDGYDAAVDFPKAGSPETDVPVAWFSRSGFAKVASRFQTDFTSMENGGATWQTTVGNLKKGVTYHCAIDGASALPDSIRCILIDKHAGVTYDMRSAAYSFLPLENESSRELELVVGTEGFAKSYLTGVRLPPQTHSLSIRMRPGTMMVNYALPWSAHAVPVRLDVIDLRGRLVSTLINESKLPGNFSAVWDTRNNCYASGMYIVRLKAGNIQLVKKGQIFR